MNYIIGYFVIGFLWGALQVYKERGTGYAVEIGMLSMFLWPLDAVAMPFKLLHYIWSKK